MNKLVLIYIDNATSRLARATGYPPNTCPAEIDDFTWAVVNRDSLPAQVFAGKDVHLVEHSFTSGFSVTDTQISEEDLARIQGLNAKADCLEQLSRSVSYLRFLKNRNLFGNPELRPEYQKEIEVFNATGTAGPLLGSLVDDDSDIPVAIAEFNIKNQTYIDFLILTETVYNKWSRKMKNSTDPYSVLEKLKTSIGPFIR